MASERRVSRTGKGPAPGERRAQQPGARGAGALRSWRDPLDSYLAHHRKTAGESGRRMLQSPLSSLMTWLVMGIAMALPVCLMLLLGSLQSVAQGWEDAARINVYLAEGVDESAAGELRRELALRDGIETVLFIPRDQALAEFRASSGLGNALDYLDQNPLPHTLVVTPAATYRSQDDLSRLGTSIRGIDGVDQVQVDLQWLQRLNTIADILQRGVTALSLLLAAAVILVIGNTIRLAIESRRDEILIVKLVGGTDAFVRRPFLYTGVWYGLGGALVAWWLVEIAFWWVGGPVEQLGALYGGGFSLQGLPFGSGLLLLLVGVGLGWLGSWVAVKRHLKAIEPT
ncbi:MAG: cell division protein FtsX [Alteromonadaceae bacterium]|nr:cell division protein FtsX [Alteromonadaceae bacterium]